ncbi:MAG: SDR family oxidoreductase [Chloroflexi bacterium SZAS-1]|jgi:3-oxoacyl-[acyl-carrier protein] reductase|nr:SDR family oxidoreductase [Chloroflexi bacterium SZAS-1]HNP86632.1 SDR family oxidoreductase [Kouleothrix sp.]
MDLQLHGKVAIVTGASRGIGRAIAHTLANAGMRLVLVARSGDMLAEVAEQSGTECLVQPADLRLPEVPAQVAAAAVARFGQIDVLVNNAGATKRGDFLALPDADWDDGFALKFFGAMRCCRAAWSHLQARHGCIINIAGIGGRTGSAEFTIGGSVNAALLNLTKALADRGQRDGVRVNAINPGSIATERLQLRIQRVATEHGIDTATAAAQLAQSLGVPRFGTPAEIAQAVAFLASPLASYCQGVLLDIDGGQTRTL